MASEDNITQSMQPQLQKKKITPDGVTQSLKSMPKGAFKVFTFCLFSKEKVAHNIQILRFLKALSVSTHKVYKQ